MKADILYGIIRPVIVAKYNLNILYITDMLCAKEELYFEIQN